MSRSRPGSYSGSTSFEFEVERLKHVMSEEYLPVDSDVDDNPMYEYVCLSLEVEGDSSFTPGKTYGLPEDCYPDEGETEITKVIGPDGKDWENKLTSSERDRIIEMIDESIRTNDYDADCDDYDDDDEPDPYWEDRDYGEEYY